MQRPLKRLALLLLAALLLCGCAKVLPDQTVICNELTIVLPGNFLDFSGESAADGLAFNYAKEAVGVCGTFENKEALQVLVPDINAQRYAELFLQTNGIDAVLLNADGIPQFAYEITTDKTMTYLCGVFQSEENFWVVQAYCESSQFPAYEVEMWEYIKTVKVN